MGQALSAHAASQQAAAAAAAPMPAPSSPGAQRCHADALHCCLAFLTLDDFLHAARACRSWRAAALHMPPLRHALTLRHARQLLLLCASPMRRHVSGIRMWYATDVSGVHLARVSGAMPHLTELQLGMEAGVLRDTWAHAMAAFPMPSLRSLSLAGTEDQPERRVWQPLIDALASTGTLTSLTLDYRICATPLQLAALTQLPALTHLAYPLGLSASQLRQVRRIPAIQHLDARQSAWGDADLLAALCGGGSPPPLLQRVDMPQACIGPDAMAQLVQLPSLRVLEPLAILMPAVPLLPRVPLLRTLRMGLTEPRLSQSEVAQWGVSLRALVHLTSLHVAWLTREEQPASYLPALLRHLPQLRLLQLTAVRVESMEDVADAAPGVEELHVSFCTGVEVADMAEAARRWQRLQVFTIDGTITLSDEERAWFEPASAHLSSLRRFVYTPMSPPRVIPSGRIGRMLALATSDAATPPKCTIS